MDWSFMTRCHIFTCRTMQYRHVATWCRGSCGPSVYPQINAKVSETRVFGTPRSVEEQIPVSAHMIWEGEILKLIPLPIHSIVTSHLPSISSSDYLWYAPYRLTEDELHCLNDCVVSRKSLLMAVNGYSLRSLWNDESTAAVWDQFSVGNWLNAWDNGNAISSHADLSSRSWNVEVTVYRRSKSWARRNVRLWRWQLWQILWRVV